MKTNKEQEAAAVLYRRAVDEEVGRVADLTASIIRAHGAATVRHDGPGADVLRRLGFGPVPAPTPGQQDAPTGQLGPFPEAWGGLFAGCDEGPLGADGERSGVDDAVRLVAVKHAAGLSDMDCLLAVHLGFTMFEAAASFGARWPHTSGSEKGVA